MNFVIVSYHFLPKGDAESFCTTRFASALADAGHDVQVVTMEWLEQVSKNVYDYIVSKNLKIVRVKNTAKNRPGILRRLRYLTDEYGVVDFDNIIKTLTSVLKATDNPILISRACPWASFIAAWHCRQHAASWICHFSDPLSYIPSYGIRGELLYRMARFWIKRCLRDADAISLTCESVKRYYHDEHGKLFDRAYSFVTPHIGEPRLPCYSSYAKPEGVRVVAHIGYLSTGRGARVIDRAIRELNAVGEKCVFHQCGPVDWDVKEIINSNRNMERLKDEGSDYASAVSSAADVIVIADQDTEFGYIPFCPSKFAYQIFSDVPIVVLTRAGSTMATCAKTFPRSGLFFADYAAPATMTAAIRAALNCSVQDLDRVEVRKLFSRKQVVEDFLNNVLRVVKA